MVNLNAHFNRDLKDRDNSYLDNFYQKHASSFVFRDRLPFEDFLKVQGTQNYHSYVWLLRRQQMESEKLGTEVFRDLSRQLSSLTPLSGGASIPDDIGFAMLKPRLHQSPSELERYIKTISDGRLSYYEALEQFRSEPSPGSPGSSSGSGKSSE